VRQCLHGLLLLALVTEAQCSDVEQKILGPEQVVRWESDVLQPHLPSAWRQLLQPVGTVCVTGDDRIGKSTLLSLWGQHLVNDSSFHFSLGHARTTHTHGIWSALAVSNATGLPYHINLCDSQGLKQISELQQRRLFATNVLLPSVLVYMLINVLQMDQLRDLARMAYHFKQLSESERGRFGEVLSPHLIIVVREESDLEGSLSQHLEDSLSGPAFEEDKALIKQVFSSREAWPLLELPLAVRSALRQDPSCLTDASIQEAQPWRESGLVILQRVLAALDARLAELPAGGPQLAEWHRSVLSTIAGGDSKSIGRLIGHGESLRAARERRQLLRAWQGPAVLMMCSMMWLSGIGGCVGRLLDRVAWCAWMLCVMGYVASSPYLTLPLQRVVPEYCEALVAEIASPVAVIACREASPFTAALLLAALFGALTYPLLSQRLWSLCSWLPLPSPVRGSLVIFLLAVGVGCLQSMQELDLDGHMSTSLTTWWYASMLVLLASGGFAGAEFVYISMGNVRRTKASETGRALHNYVRTRLEEVDQLEGSSAWSKYYQTHSRCDANWRLRRIPSWQPAAIGSQALCLLGWGALTYPHCDVILAGGAAANVLHLQWRFIVCLVMCVRRQRMDEVERWWASLEDEEDDSGTCDEEETGAEQLEKEAPVEGKMASEEIGRSSSSQLCSPDSKAKRRRRTASPCEATIVPESEEELAQRRKIEAMRRAQEKVRSWS